MFPACWDSALTQDGMHDGLLSIGRVLPLTDL